MGLFYNSSPLKTSDEGHNIFQMEIMSSSWVCTMAHMRVQHDFIRFVDNLISR